MVFEFGVMNNNINKMGLDDFSFQTWPLLWGTWRAETQFMLIRVEKAAAHNLESAKED